MANACHDRSETSIAEVCFLNLSKADAQYIENKAGTEPATAATPRTTSFDANQSGLSPQNEPKPGWHAWKREAPRCLWTCWCAGYLPWGHPGRTSQRPDLNPAMPDAWKRKHWFSFSSFVTQV